MRSGTMATTQYQAIVACQSGSSPALGATVSGDGGAEVAQGAHEGQPEPDALDCATRVLAASAALVHAFLPKKAASLSW